MKKNLAAWTAPGSNLPQFVSFNSEGGFLSGNVEITVRGPDGTVTTATMPFAQFVRLAIRSLASIEELSR